MNKNTPIWVDRVWLNKCCSETNIDVASEIYSLNRKSTCTLHVAGIDFRPISMPNIIYYKNGSLD